jgi:2-oxoglutarate ferredoxin oxidoreductase subunit beta
MSALGLIERARSRDEFITGLLYIDEGRPTLAEALNISATPLAALADSQLRPPPEALAELMSELT